MTSRRSPRAYSGDPSRRGVPRLLLVQCEKCKAKASGRVVGRKLIWANLPTWYRGSRPTHRGCGGRFVAFDLEVPGA